MRAASSLVDTVIAETPVAIVAEIASKIAIISAFQAVGAKHSCFQT